MHNLKTPLLLSFLLCSINLAAVDGWQPVADVSNVQSIPQGIELTAGPVHVRVTAISPNVVRLRYAAKGEFSDHSFAVVPAAFSETTQVRVDQSADAVTLDAGGVRARILRSPLRV